MSPQSSEYPRSPAHFIYPRQTLGSRGSNFVEPSGGVPRAIHNRAVAICRHFAHASGARLNTVRKSKPAGRRGRKASDLRAQTAGLPVGSLKGRSVVTPNVICYGNSGLESANTEARNDFDYANCILQ
jgi:hypothetical protein